MTPAKKPKGNATRLATQQDIHELETKVHKLEGKMDKKFTSTQEDIKQLDKKIDDSVERLDKKIDDSVERLDKKIDTTANELIQKIELTAEKVITELRPSLNLQTEYIRSISHAESKHVYQQESVDMYANIESNKNEILIAGNQIDENRQQIKKHEKIIAELKK